MNYDELKEEIRKYNAPLIEEPIKRPEDVYKLFLDKALEEVEQFYILSVDATNRPIKIHTISKGILNKTLVHPREVFRTAIMDNASSIFLAHNHPSGNPSASTDDLKITERMVEAGKIIGIEVLDHLIVAKNGYYSFLEEGQIE